MRPIQFRTIDEGVRHRRELWIDDETKAAHLWIFDLPMRIGSAEVRMAGRHWALMVPEWCFATKLQPR